MPKKDTPGRRRAAKAAKAAAIARSRAFVLDLNARTVCAHCGAQPIEWHNPEHVNEGRARFRIGYMASAGRAIATIQAELGRCTPLCRRCHMAEDGRLRTLQASIPPKEDPKVCEECGRLCKPRTRGRCKSCYMRWWSSRQRAEVIHACVD